MTKRKLVTNVRYPRLPDMGEDAAGADAGPEWRDKLRSFLIQGGTDGRLQRDIIFYMQHYATAVELNSHMEAWRIEGKVEKFSVPTRGRPATVWRANTTLLSELKPGGT